jgi:hypothetical protein
MSIDPDVRKRGNPYDPDDPDNYMNRDDGSERSHIIPIMFIGMFVVSVLIGLFFAQESPLTEPATHVTENAVQQPLLPTMRN